MRKQKTNLPSRRPRMDGVAYVIPVGMRIRGQMLTRERAKSTISGGSVVTPAVSLGS
jgi:hypothetical protein